MRLNLTTNLNSPSLNEQIGGERNEHVLEPLRYRTSGVHRRSKSIMHMRSATVVIEHARQSNVKNGCWFSNERVTPWKI